MLDVTDATFEHDVLERSESVAVVVDLWAPWCGPCRTLGPILEASVEATGGAVELVKVNVDENPRISQSFDVQGIPAVYAIRDREVVSAFIGAQPKAEVDAFVAKLVPVLSEADQLVAVGSASGDEAVLRRALELEPGHGGGVVALARLLVGRAQVAAGEVGGGGGERGGDGAASDGGRAAGGEVSGGVMAAAEEALALLAKVPETPETRQLAAEARLLKGNVYVTVASGAGAAGNGAAGVGADGVDALLDSLLDRVKGDEGARQEFVDLLETLGPDDPRTARYRKALAARLF